VEGTTARAVANRIPNATGSCAASATIDRVPCGRGRWQHGGVSVAAPEPGPWGEPDPRGRPLIYAVGPDTEVDGMAPSGLRPRLLKGMLAAVAVLAALVGGGVMSIWLVLAPVMPPTSASAQLRHPPPSEVGTAAPSGLSTEPTVVDSDLPVATPQNGCRFRLSG
jgi:hypothetical protein